MKRSFHASRSIPRAPRCPHGLASAARRVKKIPRKTYSTVVTITSTECGDRRAGKNCLQCLPSVMRKEMRRYLYGNSFAISFLSRKHPRPQGVFISLLHPTLDRYRVSLTCNYSTCTAHTHTPFGVSREASQPSTVHIRCMSGMRIGTEIAQENFHAVV